MNKPFVLLATALRGLLVLSSVWALVVAGPASAEPSEGPALWKIEGASSTVYLFGTFHVLPPDLIWSRPHIDAALAASDFLITEADTSDEAQLMDIIQKHALNAQGVTLRSLLSADEILRANAVLEEFGVSVDNFAPHQPWFVALQASITAMMQLGFDPASGVEEVLARKATATNKQLGYLESAEEGILSLAGHPVEIQVEMLMATFDDIESVEDTLGRMMTSWAEGDIDDVGKLMNASMAGSPELIEAVLYARNRNWLPKIEAMIAADGVYFIAVGTGHLAGQNSVIELLEAQGLTPVRQ